MILYIRVATFIIHTFYYYFFQPLSFTIALLYCPSRGNKDSFSHIIIIQIHLFKKTVDSRGKLDAATTVSTFASECLAVRRKKTIFISAHPPRGGMAQFHGDQAYWIKPQKKHILVQFIVLSQRISRTVRRGKKSFKSMIQNTSSCRRKSSLGLFHIGKVSNLQELRHCELRD